MDRLNNPKVFLLLGSLVFLLGPCHGFSSMRPAASKFGLCSTNARASFLTGNGGIKVLSMSEDTTDVATEVSVPSTEESTAEVSTPVAQAGSDDEGTKVYIGNLSFGMYSNEYMNCFFLECLLIFV